MDNKIRVSSLEGKQPSDFLLSSVFFRFPLPRGGGCYFSCFPSLLSPTLPPSVPPHTFLLSQGCTSSCFPSRVSANEITRQKLPVAFWRQGRSEKFWSQEFQWYSISCGFFRLLPPLRYLSECLSASLFLSLSLYRFFVSIKLLNFVDYLII